MRKEPTEEHFWNNSDHNYWIAECFSTLCFKDLPPHEQPETVILKDGTGYFINLTPQSEKVFFKLVRDLLNQVPKNKLCFTRPVSKMKISDIESLTALIYVGEWSVYMFPNSNEWSFFFENEDDAVMASLSI